MMADTSVKQILARPIQLADQVAKAVNHVQLFKQECVEIKAKAEKLSRLLRKAAKASNEQGIYPCRIVHNTEHVLEKAFILVGKCRGSCGIFHRVFTFVSATAFHETSVQLEDSIRDLSWLLRVDVSLCLVWERIAALHTGSLEERSHAAATLMSLARDNVRYGRLIVEEGAVPPLLKLAKEGKSEGREYAVTAIGVLGRDPENMKDIVKAGVGSVFAKILKKGPMKAQIVVAWAVSELAEKCRDHFGRSNVVRLLVNHLEDPKSKARMKVMAARALWKLLKGNFGNCRSITEPRALLCFATLLEKGSADDVRFFSAMALMEIAIVAENHDELRWSGFKPTTVAARAVVDQLLRVVVEEAGSDLMIPCIKSIGCLARTFRATETRVIGPLVRLLETSSEAEILTEAAAALIKFASTNNFLHVNHCKGIIDSGGVKHLVRLVYSGEQMVQFPCLVLLSYIALHVPDNETLACEDVLIVLEWSAKQALLNQEPIIKSILPKAKRRLELYQSIRGSQGFQ